MNFTRPLTPLLLLAPLAPLAPLALLAPACSTSRPDKSAAPARAAEDASGKTWTRLIEGSWTLGPYEEKERFCTKKLLTEDVYVSAIRPVHPLGTHHTLLTLGDGIVDCTTAVVNGLIYAAGVGSEGLELPPGVAIKLPKGKYVNLGLHLFNTTQDSIEGTSAMEIVTMDAKDVKYESEAVLSGPFTLNLPPGKQTLVTHDCQVTTDQSVWALFPHMHQYGTHIKTTFTMGGVETVIHDGDYHFNEQFQLPLDPVVPLHAGDSVHTECTYDNTSAKAVHFGESSTTEMCFSVLFRYPPQGSGFCAGGGAAGGDAGTPPALTGPPCALPGAPGNEVGVGKLCSKGGGECAGNQSATFCLADYASGSLPNFCTELCQSDADCGTGAVCRGTPGRAVCFPTSCVPDGGASASDGG